ncbi:uncharacterized protein [Prorops nasuta]|uniref:uncharacterized protein n=1 Tax=Prorops nasuta TaxID=863751 RepID=UPI0034CDF60C
MQQHVASLLTLGVNVTPEMAVHIIETKLPKSVFNSWETSLSREEYPSLDKMYEFLYRCAVNASRRERGPPKETDNNKLEGPPKKRRRVGHGQSFAAQATTTCIACKRESHPLFRCDMFKEKDHDQYLPQLLTTAVVLIQTRDNTYVSGRALLDTGATGNFVSESMAKQLKTRIQPCATHIVTVDGMKTLSPGSVRITIKATNTNYAINLRCFILPKISDAVPTETFNRKDIKIPANIKLADPQFHIARPVDLLIGSKETLSLLAIGQIRLLDERVDVCLQKTQLGWVVAGGLRDYDRKEQAYYSLSLEHIMKSFWEVEEVSYSKHLSKEEMECENHFIKTVARDKTSRYIVRLPFKQKCENFIGSRDIAVERLKSLERRFKSNETLEKEYTRIFDEYLKLGHMSMLNDENDQGYYLTHHSVLKESSRTTKLRIVFDASAKDKAGISLNDTLMVGPTIQDRLVQHLTRFRMYSYVITADIEKMYRQVLVDERDRKFQQILWRHDGHIHTFQLNTLTFGVSSSPFLAIRSVHQLIEDEGANYPNAAKVLKEHL